MRGQRPGLLFDGETLAGWGVTGRPEGWTVQDGCILCTAQKGGYLYAERPFENFMLSVDFKIDPKVNSGIFVRVSDLSDPVDTGLEVQILDSYGSGRLDTHTCGAIYDLVPPGKDVFRPPGAWNRAVIRCEGPHVRVELNDETIATMNVDEYAVAGRNPDGSRNKFKYAWRELPRSGHVALQDHGGKVWFCNIKIREL